MSLLLRVHAKCINHLASPKGRIREVRIGIRICNRSISRPSIKPCSLLGLFELCFEVIVLVGCKKKIIGANGGKYVDI